MAGLTPLTPESGSRFDALRSFIPDKLHNPLAMVGATAITLGGGLSTELYAGSRPAFAQGTPSTQSTANESNSTTCQAPQDTSKPYDGCWNLNLATDQDVEFCQDLATNRAQNKIDFIASVKIKHKIGKKHITVNNGLRRLSAWEGNKFIYACSSVTHNYVRLRVVENMGNAKRPRAKDTKTIGKVVIARGNDSTKFDGIINEIVHTKKTISLPEKLTGKDLHKHKFGVKETIVSEPTIQVPYYDSANPTQDIPGPMKTVQSKPHILWLH